MKFLCKIFGHSWKLIPSDRGIAGPWKCQRCDEIESPIKWPDPPSGRNSKMKHGLYRIHWKSGGSSLASVGSMHNGDRWIAPTNWTSDSNPTGLLKDKVDDIKRMELLHE